MAKSNSRLPVIAITMGDPAGVGPEIAIKALGHSVIHQTCRPLILGSSEVLEKATYIVGSTAKLLYLKDLDNAYWEPNHINILETGLEKGIDFPCGEVSAIAGELGFRAIERAILLAKQGSVEATVTGPIHKEALNLAGHNFAGQTEIFAHLTKTKDYAMLLMAGALRVIHVSTHVSLREACLLVTRERVATVIRLAHEAGSAFGIANPRIAVSGLNPHASDGGLFGSEDLDEIVPAVRVSQMDGISVEGPLPADTLFPKANGGYYDFVVAMYHDQGHIPLKTAGFTWDNVSQSWSKMEGVNVTIGIPIIRVSVDHGTAFDVAGTGKASEDNMVEAILHAVQMANVRCVNNAKLKL